MSKTVEKIEWEIVDKEILNNKNEPIIYAMSPPFKDNKKLKNKIKLPTIQ